MGGTYDDSFYPPPPPPNSRSPQESHNTARQPNFQPNAFYLGDNLDVLRSFDSDTVDLIATDPPFNKKRDAFEGNLKGGGKAKFKDNWHWVDPDPNKGKRHDPDAIENHADWLESIEKHHHRVHALITATRDVYGDDMAAFLCWLGVRILEMHRVLKPTGSMYLHIDHTAHAYVKALMDAVFGKQNFRNEIVWDYKKISNSGANKFNRAHDIILFYVKSKEGIFNRQYESELSVRKQELVRAGYNTKRMNGERYLYIYDEDTFKEKERLGKINREDFDYVRYVDITKGNVLTDVFKVDHLNSQSKENVGYPTQKPLALYERMIRASSNPGDIVLDPFAGCATTAVAAQHLRRNWVAIDIEVEGYNLTQQRMRDERALDQQAIVIGPAITDLPVRRDDGRTAADALNPKPRKQRPPSKIDKDRDRKLDILIGKFGLRCWGCGFTPPGDVGRQHGRDFFELDHIRPQSDSGTHDIRNRSVLCGPCNRRKGGFGGTLADLRKQNETEQRLYGRLIDIAEVIDWHARYDDEAVRLL